MKTKTALLICLFVFVSGCKQEQADKTDTTAPPKAEPMLKTSGCSVHKTKGVLKVECADGSMAEAGVPTYHIKDATGTSLDNLMFLQNWSQVGVLAINKKSGNILSYGSSGEITKINRTLYESFDCSGQAYAFFSDFIVRNKVMANSGGGHSSVEAFRVTGYVSETKSFNSRVEGGACLSWSGSSGGAATVEATVFDDTDPIAIGLPIEIVFEQ